MTEASGSANFDLPPRKGRRTVATAGKVIRSGAERLLPHGHAHGTAIVTAGISGLCACVWRLEFIAAFDDGSRIDTSLHIPAPPFFFFFQVAQSARCISRLLGKLVLGKRIEMNG
jgi:hypothetical protein